MFHLIFTLIEWKIKIQLYRKTETEKRKSVDFDFLKAALLFAIYSLYSKEPSPSHNSH